MSLRDTVAEEVGDLLGSNCCAPTQELVRLLPSAYRDAVTFSYGEHQPPCLDLVLDGREAPAAITRVDLDVMPLHEAAHMVGAHREARDLRKALEGDAPELVLPAVLAALRAVFAVRWDRAKGLGQKPSASHGG